MDVGRPSLCGWRGRLCGRAVDVQVVSEGREWAISEYAREEGKRGRVSDELRKNGIGGEGNYFKIHYFIHVNDSF